MFFVQQTTLAVPASHAEHGEDYVIEWQDPVMEKHVRKWLDRPKGDIYHSDVWDYQRVTINSGTGVKDLLVKDAPDGVDIGGNVSSNEQLAACAVRVEGTYDPVASLADLRHFDSLQVLSVNNRRGDPPITDLTGLEVCKNLMLLEVPSVESGAFPTFAKLDSVVKLEYGSDGIRADSNVSDLSALAQMKSLKMLWITGSEVDLTQLAGADLRVLKTGRDPDRFAGTAEADGKSELSAAVPRAGDRQLCPAGGEQCAVSEYVPLSGCTGKI